MSISFIDTRTIKLYTVCKELNFRVGVHTMGWSDIFHVSQYADGIRRGGFASAVPKHT